MLRNRFRLILILLVLILLVASLLFGLLTYWPVLGAPRGSGADHRPAMLLEASGPSSVLRGRCSSA